MKLKKTYTISIEEEMVAKIEKVKETYNLSYTEIFIEALNKYLEEMI